MPPTTLGSKKRPNDKDQPINGKNNKKVKKQQHNKDMALNDARPMDIVFDVEEILDKKITENGHAEYLIKWVGYEENTWEPIKNLKDCDDLIEEYEEGINTSKFSTPSTSKSLVKSPAIKDKPKFQCLRCDKLLSSKGNLERHYITHDNNEDKPLFKCKDCPIEFHREDNLTRHIQRKHMASKGATKNSKRKGKIGKPERIPFTAYQPNEKPLVESLEAAISTTDVEWEQVAGSEVAIKLLKRSILHPILNPELYTGIRAPIKGLLLFGPPGTGKTLLANAVASKCQSTFFSISPSSIASKYTGESEKLVKLLFRMAEHYSPSVIFIDEIDSLCSHRKESDNECSQKVKAELLSCISEMKTHYKNVFLLGATNLPWSLDAAMRRRLPKRILVPMPSYSTRKKIIKMHMEEFVNDDFDYGSFSKKLAGFSCDDIYNLCKTASLIPVERKTDHLSDEKIKKLKPKDMDLKVTNQDFQTAVENTNKSVSETDVKSLNDWFAKYGSK